MNPQLEMERRRATFAPEQLTFLLDGGKDRTERRRYLESVIENDPTGVFDNSDNLYLHRTDRHVRALAKHVRLVELARMLGIGTEPQSHGDIVRSPDFALLLQAIADDLPTALHWIMFVPNILSLADDQQQAQWLPLCRDWRMIGCYAQTELGHGSNIRALETTATYVPPSNDHPDGSWMIHSPTLTSAKFWPGTLGRTATHAMVIARLIDGLGVDRGIHNFLVPLRHPLTHQLLPGVETGDIGPKLGYNTMDNGFARFNRVVVPRRNMLMRFAQVDSHGRYSKRTASGGDAAERIAYITMMQVRAHIVNEAGKNLAQACCVAIRYSAVRLQGFADPQDASTTAPMGTVPTEVPVLDYQQQQHRLFPLLAASYCFFFTGKQLLQRLHATERQLVEGSTAPKGGGRSTTAHVVSKNAVADLHASSSALKSYTTTVAADGIEECRKACGGHGYLACSGLTELVTTYLQNPTVEGDNHMLPQQVIKVLLKLLPLVQESLVKPIDWAQEYRGCDSLRLIPYLLEVVQPGKQLNRCCATSPGDLYRLEDVIVPAFGHRAARLLVRVGSQLRQDSSSKRPAQAWNGALVLMARASKAYAQFLLLENMVRGVLQESQSSSQETIGPAETQVLLDLARLLALSWMQRDLGDFCEDAYLSPQQAGWVHRGVESLLETIRPNAVALVDARDFSDFRLKSALGRNDGNVYPAILEVARRDPLNQTDPGPGAQHIRRLVVDGVGAYTGTAARL